MGKRHSPSFPWKEVPRRGGGWNRRGMKGNMRKAVSHIVIPSGAEGSLPFAVRDSRVPHMCRALLRFPHLSFIPLEPYPARYARHLPHAGKALSVVILFPHMRVFALRLWGKRYSRIAAFPMGEGLRYGICFSFICFHARPGAFASCHPTAPFSRVQGRFLVPLEMTRGGRTVIRGRACSLLASPTFSAKRSHFLRKEHLRNHHSPPILSAFSHRLAPRGSSMDFFKNKRVSPHFLQI